MTKSEVILAAIENGATDEELAVLDATPEIELININNDAVVTICLGLPALNKNRIGLKKIPPPIPTTPDIKPKSPHIIKEKKIDISL